MSVAIFGAGYVGLACTVNLAMRSYDVSVVDVNAERIAMLREGKCPIHERSMPQYIESFVTHPGFAKAGLVKFTTDAVQAIQDSRVALICVGTPSDETNNLSIKAVKEVFQQIVEHCAPGYTIIVKSTMPIGGMQQILNVLQRLKAVNLYYMPEFLREGRALKDIECPERIVLGAETAEFPKLDAWMAELVQDSSDNFICVDYRTAELAKLAANAMLASRLSFMNEMAELSENIGADIQGVEAILGSDSRIGHEYLRAGLGWGGYCLPKDLSALHTSQKAHRLEGTMVAATHRVNGRINSRLLERLRERFPVMHKKTFAVWGCAFKGGTDDVRESPAVRFITSLASSGAMIRVYDPAAKCPVGGNGVVQVGTAQDCLYEADALIVLTDWEQFRFESPMTASLTMRERVMFDARNCMPHQNWIDLGFEYHSMGRPVVSK